MSPHGGAQSGCVRRIAHISIANGFICVAKGGCWSRGVPLLSEPGKEKARVMMRERRDNLVGFQLRLHVGSLGRRLFYLH